MAAATALAVAIEVKVELEVVADCKFARQRGIGWLARMPFPSRAKNWITQTNLDKQLQVWRRANARHKLDRKSVCVACLLIRLANDSSNAFGLSLCLREPSKAGSIRKKTNHCNELASRTEVGQTKKHELLKRQLQTANTSFERSEMDDADELKDIWVS